MAERLFHGLTLPVIGMGVVFLALFVLDLFIRLMGLIDRGANRAAERDRRGAVAPAPAGLAEEEVAAIIAAAVAVVLDREVHIHYIRLLDEDMAAWARSGRLDIMRSHVPH